MILFLWMIKNSSYFSNKRTLQFAPAEMTIQLTTRNYEDQEKWSNNDIENESNKNLQWPLVLFENQFLLFCSVILLNNVSLSKNPDIKTPLVVSFSLGVVIHFSPLEAFWCQDSSNDSHYTIWNFPFYVFDICFSIKETV